MPHNLDEMRALLAEVQADIAIANRLQTGIDTATLQRTADQLEKDIAREAAWAAGPYGHTE